MKNSMTVRVAVAAAILVTSLMSAASAQTVAAAPDPALAAVFAISSPAQTSGIRLVACGPFCDTSIHETSATISGSGSSCTTAQSSLTTQLQNIAKSRCQTYWGDLGSCSLVVNTTVACSLIAPGTYQVQGYATYSCRDNNC